MINPRPVTVMGRKTGRGNRDVVNEKAFSRFREKEVE
jgi:hypothetical protein